MKLQNTALGFALAVIGVLTPFETMAVEKLTIKLSDVEQAALAFSPRLKAAESDAEAVAERSKGAGAMLWPRLGIEATDRYVSKVPELTILPTQPPRSFGAHENYSVGPALNWTIWDSGALFKSWRSAQALGRSKQEELKLARAQTILNARSAYFRVQLSLEQLQLVADSLKVVEAQYRDIDNRLRAGASSKIDALSAHKEVLNLTLQLKQAQTDFLASLRDLVAQTGPELVRGQDLAALAQSAGANVAFDQIDESLTAFQKQVLGAPGPAVAHPQIELYRYLADASALAAQSANAQHWPKVQLYAKASIDYPNGPVLEKVQQNTVALTASWSIFEAGRVLHEAAERRAQAAQAEHRKEQAEIELNRDWLKARDQFESLRAQQEIHRNSVTETEELSRLIYTSYRAGRSSVLEVENANLRALEAKVQLARNKVQTLLQLAILEELK